MILIFSYIGAKFLFIFSLPLDQQKIAYKYNYIVLVKRILKKT